MSEKIVVTLAVCLMKGIALLPLRWIQSLGGLLGQIITGLRLTPAKITRTNLALCFPEKSEAELQVLTRQSMQETAKTMLEFSYVWFRTSDAVLAKIQSVEGEHWVAEAQAAGRGVLFLGPHHGNWEVTGLYLASRYDMASMFRPPKMKEFERVITAARGRTSAELVPTNQRGVARLLTILKKGGVVGVLPDQVPAPNSAEFAPFFGEAAHTMTLVSRLIQKTRPVVLMAYALRLAGGEGYRLIIRPADEGVHSEDLVASLTAINASVERAVREAIPQYQWEYKRFRRRLPGQKKLY